MKISDNYTITESDLIRGCIAKDRKMQKLLYDRYSPKMYVICLRYCKDNEQINDMLQEGFIKVYTFLETFRGEGPLEGWLRRIFVHNCLGKIKKEKKLQVIGLNMLHDKEDETTLGILDNFNTQEIIKLIQKLPRGYGSVFNLHIVEGYSHKEIAGILDIQVPTSKSQLARAKNYLRKLIEKERILN